MKHKLMAAIRTASLKYRKDYGKNPHRLYLSSELTRILVGRGNYICGLTDLHYDNNHCTLRIHVTSPEAGPGFNFISSSYIDYMRAYQAAVTEYCLLTDSNSCTESNKCEKNDNRINDNVISISGKRNGSI